jgi:Flp pilus assembly pilin Flp
MHIKLKNKRGQSTVEYVLLVTAVIAVIIAFTTGKGTNSLQNQLNTTLNDVAQDINSEQLVNSHASSNAATDTTPPYSITLCGGKGQPVCTAG